MLANYSKEQIEKIFNGLSDSLKETILSTETADNIYSICQENNIDKISQFAALVGNVLMGILSPKEFQEKISEQFALTTENSNIIFQRTYRLIFYPVQTELQLLYPAENLQGSPVQGISVPKKEKEEVKENIEVQEIKTKKTEKVITKKEDTYREEV